MTNTPDPNKGETPVLSVIIAARDEQDYINACLSALLAQSAPDGSFEVIVAANACSDQTVTVARNTAADFSARGLRLAVLDLAEGGKTLALNAGDAIAVSANRVYLDADVICDQDLFAQFIEAMQVAQPRYVTGTLAVSPGQSLITRAYARIWTRLPFVKGGAVGAGLFAVNRAGRARWDVFPSIISDDTFVRLQFSNSERTEVDACYHWPMVEGLRNLIQVRHRQDMGVAEIYREFPDLRKNAAQHRPRSGEMVMLFLGDPFGFLIYALVAVSVRLRRKSAAWTRGR